MFVCLLLFYVIATLFQLYNDGHMTYEMRRRKPEPTLLLNQECGIRGTSCKLYTAGKWITVELNVIGTRIRIPVPTVT